MRMTQSICSALSQEGEDQGVRPRPHRPHQDDQLITVKKEGMNKKKGLNKEGMNNKEDANDPNLEKDALHQMDEAMARMWGRSNCVRDRDALVNCNFFN